MVSGRSLLGPADVQDIKQIRRDGIATGFAISDPPVSLVFERMNTTTGVITTDPPVAVIVSWDTRSGQQAEIVGPAGGAAPITGRFKSWDTWTPRRGDRFALPDGRTGEIHFVPPSRGGATRAFFTLDTGL